MLEKSSIDNGASRPCHIHNEEKQDLFNDGEMICESCFAAYFHADGFNGVAEEDREARDA